MPGAPRKVRPVLLLAAILMAGTLGGCSDSVVEVGNELSLELTGPASAPVSDSLEVSFEVEGRRLLGLVLEYGDGAVDSVSFSGSQSAGGYRSHKYTEPGTYLVTGKVQDGVEGTIMAELSVTMTP